MDISEDAYFQERLDKQIDWYDTKSGDCQKRFKIIRCSAISLSASIPFLIGFISDFSFFEEIVSGIAVIIVILEAMLSITKYHENWIEYRSICETLKHEKYMYLTRTGVYDIDNPFKVLVERAENVISRENVNWASLNNNNNGGE